MIIIVMKTLIIGYDKFPKVLEKKIVQFTCYQILINKVNFFPHQNEVN